MSGKEHTFKGSRFCADEVISVNPGKLSNLPTKQASKLAYFKWSTGVFVFLKCLHWWNSNSTQENEHWLFLEQNKLQLFSWLQLPREVTNKHTKPEAISWKRCIVTCFSSSKCWKLFFFLIEQIIKSYMQNSESLNYMLKQLNTSYSHFISGSLEQQLTVY